MYQRFDDENYYRKIQIINIFIHRSINLVEGGGNVLDIRKFFLFSKFFFSTNVICSEKNKSQFKEKLTLYSINTHLDASTTDSFSKHCEKRRNCSKRAISPFPTMFSTKSDNCTPSVHILDIIFHLLLNCKSPKLTYEVKG